MKRFLLVLSLLLLAGPASAQSSRVAAALGLLSTDGDLGSSTATECVMLEASAVNCDTTSGCATADVAGTVFDFTVADFDTTSDEFGAWTFPVPSNITGTTFTAQYYWSTAACTATSADDACLTVAATGVTDDEAWNTATLGTAVGITDTCTTANDLYISDVFTVTHGWVAGDRAAIEVARDVDGGITGCSDDNLAGDARLHAVEVCYEVNNVFSGE